MRICKFVGINKNGWGEYLRKRKRLYIYMYYDINILNNGEEGYSLILGIFVFIYLCFKLIFI